MRRAISILVMALLLALMTSLAANAAPSEWAILGHHTVRSGETLFCIGRAYGVSPWAIASQNGITAPSRIHAGTVLHIPAAYAVLPSGPVCTRQFGAQTPACVCGSTYIVTSGDTLTRIAITYSVSMWRIAECNYITNLNYIRAGDALCIPNN